MILRIRIVFLVALAVLSLTGALYEPTNLSCASLNSTTLMFSWTLPASGIFTVNGYHLNLQRTDNIRVENIPHVDTGSVYVENYTYYKIGKYAEYTLTMHSYTASGNDTDVSVTCRTDEDAPDGGPPSVNSTGISYTEISVIWTEPPRYHHNGILLGYKLVYHAYLSQFPQEVVLSNTTFAYTITGLEYDTWYVISVLPYTTVGDGPRTSYPEKTLGPTTKAPEEVTKYYCYEAIPGTLVFSWESMPCTIYVGVIGALFLFLLMALVACCCKGSKKIKEKHTSNVQMMPPVIHLKEKVKVIQAMNKFKKNRKGGENGTNDNRDMDYNGNSFGRGVSNSFTNNFGDGNPKVRPGRGGNDYDVGEDDGRGKRKGLWGMGLNNLLGKGREGSKDKLVDDRQDPYGDPECSRWNSGRSKQRGDPFDIRAGKNAATASALRARGKKNNTVSPLNFDDEGYYDDDGDEYGDDSGDLTARDIRLFSKQPSKNSNPDIARRGSKKGNTTVPVLDKRFNRDISGVDLYLEDNDDNYDDEYFEHPPPAPRFHLGDDASVDLPLGGEGVGLKGGIPLGADGDDAAFF